MPPKSAPSEDTIELVELRQENVLEKKETSNGQTMDEDDEEEDTLSLDSSISDPHKPGLKRHSRKERNTKLCLLILLMLFIGGSITGWVFWGLQVQIEDLYLDPTEAIQLNLIDCNLNWFTESSTYHTEGNPIFLRAVRNHWEQNAFVSTSGGVTTIQRLMEDSLDTCEVTIVVAPGTILTSVEIYMEAGKDSVLTAGLRGLNVGGEVLIEGSATELDVVDSTASSFSVSVAKGPDPPHPPFVTPLIYTLLLIQPLSRDHHLYC